MACGFIPLEDLTEIINERAEECRQFVLKIFELEQEFLKAIRNQQQEFVDEFGLDFIDNKHRILIRNIYDAKEFKVLSGE